MNEVYEDWRTIIMKKRLFALLLAAALCMTMVACGKDENTEKVDELASAMQDLGAVGIITPSESVMAAMAKEWCVAGCDDTYEMSADGTGAYNDNEFTFECGFNKDNDITMNIVMGETEETYIIDTDETGYGVILTAIKGGEDKTLLPADLEFLALDDERIAGIAADWKDASGNIYKLGEDFDLVIDGVKNDSEGTYCVVQNEEGEFFLNLVINGSAFGYGFELDADNNELTLWGADSDSDTTYIWTK